MLAKRPRTEATKVTKATAKSSSFNSSDLPEDSELLSLDDNIPEPPNKMLKKALPVNHTPTDTKWWPNGKF